MKIIHVLAFILLVVGGLNWLAFAAFGQEIGSLLGGMDSMASKAVYVLVGLAALWELVMHRKQCTACGSGAAM